MKEGKISSKNTEQGFTLVEVLVGILIVSGFTIGAMQTLVLSAYFRVRAQEYSLASNAVLQNLEEVKFWADRYYDSATHETRCQATNSDNGYAAGLRSYINTNVSVPASIAITGRNFPMERTLQVYDATLGARAPYNVLRVFYRVRDPNITNIEQATAAYFQTELIPGGAFQCPLNF